MQFGQCASLRLMFSDARGSNEHKGLRQSRVGWLLVTLAALAFCAQPTRGWARSSVVHAHIVVDAATGRVLEAYNANRRAHPASLTKLMTLYLTFQELESGKLTLNTRMRVSRHAARQQPTKLWLRPGSTITVRDAILGITTRSANDAAVVLAEHLGHSEAHFAQLMNVQARKLGMMRTVFYNASGLPNRRQWTTARDMALLGVALIHRYPEYYHFFGVKAFRFHGRTVYGHNHLLDECEGVDGMKTGYVSASGFNIVTSAERDGRRLVGVVLGGRTARARDLKMASLIHKGFGHGFTQHSAAEALATLTFPVLGKSAKTKHVSANADDGAGNDGAWVIEVGGNFSTQHSVRRILKSARLSAPTLRRNGRGIVVALHGRRYRARFSHLEGSEAMEACRALKRKKYSCRIVRRSPPPSEDFASAGSANMSDSD
ncbi:MAG: D-alanyl-D-alanine carboxypeptidase [Acidobacteriota bacterium]|nr:D-alanyl-D-alanine carboxypeptidase [Acidobacteriota bacterium]